MSSAAPNQDVDVHAAPPGRLALMLDLDVWDSACDLWQPDELAAILRSHLAAPLDGDGRGKHVGLARGDRGDVDATSGPEDERPSLGEMLFDPKPSEARLRRVCEYAAESRTDPATVMPPEIATFLFYCGTAAALVRGGGKRLADLDDAALSQGLGWAARQSWADDGCRTLVAEAMRLLESSGVPAGPPPDLLFLPPVGSSADGLTVFPLSGERSPADETDALPPPQVPGYRITGRLGEGGMGVVWRAEQNATRRQVALKVVASASAASPRARLRFEREVELAASLEHPHIARVYDSGSCHGVYYYAMELVEGVDLDKFVAERKLGPRDILALLRDLCLAVQHAHQRGVIHRDLKPSNVLVTGEGQPKVLDFGLAKLLGEVGQQHDLTLTQDGQVAGTPAFMSPEQAAGRVDRLDTRTDVYSLGVVLYLLLAGRNPHDLSGPRYEVLRRVATEDVRPPRQVSKAVDAELEALLLKALDRDPDRRYASAGELAKDLDAYLKGEPLTARAPTLAYLAAKRLRKHRLPLGVAAAVLALLLGTGVFSYLRVLKHGRVAVANERVAKAEARAADAAREAAESERRKAELSVAQAKVAEGDALMASDEFGQARQRYDEARLIHEGLGANTFWQELALWDAHRRSPTPLMELVGHTAQVNCLAYLPDGLRMVTAGEDGTARVWDAVTGACLRVIGGVGRVQRLSLSADGKTVALAGRGRGVTLWDVESGTAAGEVTGFVGDALSVAFSPDGRRLLVGTSDAEHNACLFDIGSKELLLTLRGHTSPVRAVAFTPDGRTGITGSGRLSDDFETYQADATLRAWDLADGRQLWAQAGAAQGRLVTDVALSPDGSAILTGTYLGAAETWDVSTGRRSGHFMRESQPDGLAFSPDGLLIATATRGGVVEVSWASGEPLGGNSRRTLFFGGERSVRFSPDARFVAAAAEDRVRVWPLYDIATNRALGPGMVNWWPSPVEYFAASFSPDGRMALATEGSPEDAGEGRLVRLWDVAAGQELAQVAASDAAFVPGSNLVLVAEADGALALWNDLSRQQRVRVLEPPRRHQPAKVEVAADGRVALAWSRGSNEVRLYDMIAGGSHVRTMKLEGAAEAVRTALSSDATIAAACSREGLVRVWDVETGGERRTWKTGVQVNRVAISRDGTLLACVGPELQVFDIRSGETVFRRRWPIPLFAVAFMPDGHHLVVGGEGYGSDWTFVDVRSGATRSVKTPAGFIFDWDIRREDDGRLRLLAAQRGLFGNVRC